MTLIFRSLPGRLSLASRRRPVSRLIGGSLKHHYHLLIPRKRLLSYQPFAQLPYTQDFQLSLAQAGSALCTNCHDVLFDCIKRITSSESPPFQKHLLRKNMYYHRGFGRSLAVFRWRFKLLVARYCGNWSQASSSHVYHFRDFGKRGHLDWVPVWGSVGIGLDT